jgi:hypothetical protein
MSIREKGAVEMGTNAAVPRKLREPIEAIYEADNTRPNHFGRPRVEAVKALCERGLCEPDSTVTLKEWREDDGYWDQTVKVSGICHLLRLKAQKSMGQVRLVIEPV